MNDPAPRKFFDIAHPGNVRPSSTSRPVITQNRPSNPDPFLREQPARPIKATPEPAPVAEQATPEATPDPISLLIHADAYQPLKASKGRGQRAAVIVMLVLLVILSGISYLMVSYMV